MERCYDKLSDFNFQELVSLAINIAKEISSWTKIGCMDVLWLTIQPNTLAKSNNGMMYNELSDFNFQELVSLTIDYRNNFRHKNGK